MTLLVGAVEQRVVEEVKLEDVALEEVGTIVDALAHSLYVSAVERRCVDVVFIGETCQEVARSCATIPYVVLFLPVLTQFGGDVLLRQFHPAGRCEETAFALTHVLWH